MSSNTMKWLTVLLSVLYPVHNFGVNDGRRRELLDQTNTFQLQGSAHCGPALRTDSSGIIQSPNYPRPYPRQISCTWCIMAPQQSRLSISVIDLDLEEDQDCQHPPCCSQDWLSLPIGNPAIKEPGMFRQICGRNITIPHILLQQQKAVIEFHAFSSESINRRNPARGFQLRYSAVPRCRPPQLLCGSSDDCYTLSQRCDGTADCTEGTDEKECHSPTIASAPIPCKNENGEELPHCDNGLCLRNGAWCNGKDDCGDGSDERGCIRNSVIAAAIMGSLLSSLVFVIVVGCTCCRLRRFPAFLFPHNHLQHGNSLINGSSPTAGIRELQPPTSPYGRHPLPPLDERVLAREPPPPYTAAVSSENTLSMDSSVGVLPVRCIRNSPCRPHASSRHHHQQQIFHSQRHLTWVEMGNGNAANSGSSGGRHHPNLRRHQRRQRRRYFPSESQMQRSNEEASASNLSFPPSSLDIPCLPLPADTMEPKHGKCMVGHEGMPSLVSHRSPNSIPLLTSSPSAGSSSSSHVPPSPESAPPSPTTSASSASTNHSLVSYLSMNCDDSQLLM
ncbi:low-density lipoprotein receptor-related protein 12-like [Hetaerina americana]|uniref:low-density lipoprotein receptor-related protein 12-like n=1 Tax=Hetaerina americana TaxID=62018 RepID=UPI003A7F5210